MYAKKDHQEESGDGLPAIPKELIDGFATCQRVPSTAPQRRTPC